MSDDLNNLVLDIREHVRFLAELGVDTLEVEMSEPVPNDMNSRQTRTIADQAAAGSSSIEFPVIRTETAKERRPAGSLLADLPSLSKRPISVKPRGDDQPVPRPSGDGVAGGSVPKGDPHIETAINAIRSEIGNCVRCPLHEGRTQIVHSTGSLSARLMFVGEAPGADEDIEGRPFVGRAGKLLTDIITGMGFRREDVFIGNINRCRPPGNRQPMPIETEACRPFLLREIDVIKPKVIVVLGNTATQNLLSIKTPISKIRGQFQEYFGVKVMPTFHPAYLLRDPHKKREVWEDMKKVRDHINLLTDK